MIYIYPKLSSYNLLFFRLSGPGLGNLLFPWARAVVCAKKYQLALITPTWIQFNFGPFLRNEKDKRIYSDIFEASHDEISGFRKIRNLLLYDRVDEDYFTQDPFKVANAHQNLIIDFSGTKNFFEDIIFEDYSYIRSRLVENIKEKHVDKALSFDFSKSISLHVRLSDFKVGNITTPTNFFINKVNQLRAELGNWKVFIFSDGAEDELTDLLKLPDSYLLSFGSSISDLLALSKSNILIASKNSTFSGWASYLGRMPVIWPNGSNIKIYRDKDLEIFSEINQRLPASFFNNFNRL